MNKISNLIRKRKPDERLEKEGNVLAAKMFYVITFLLLASLIVKLVCKLPIQVYALEVLCLLSSGIYFFVQEIRKGILGMRKKDEALREIHRSVLSKAFMIDFWLLIAGELIFIYAVKDYFIWVLSYIIAWVPPGLVITIASVKKGWLIHAGKEQRKKGLKPFLGRVILGSLVYGILMGFSDLYHDGAFHAKGILSILGMGAGWGVLFSFGMILISNLSTKHADQRLESAENGDEE